MEPEFLIILYSKYSPQCQKILQVYNENYMDYIKLICVDNSCYRQKILNSKSLNIKTVPCVLLMYTNDKIEKFEGKGVTEWILKQISNNLPQDKTPIELGEKQNNSSAENNENKFQTDIESLTLIDAPKAEDTVPRHYLPEQQQNTTRTKSIQEIAAEMQASRKDLDKPTQKLMEEMNNVSFQKAMQ